MLLFTDLNELGVDNFEVNKAAIPALRNKNNKGIKHVSLI